MNRCKVLLCAGVLGAATAAAAGCSGREATGASEAASTTAIDRLIIGKAAGYAADTGLASRLGELEASQAARRTAAWQVVARAIEPVPVDPSAADGGETSTTMPRFQTWYGRDEVVPMFEHILLGQSEADRKAHVPPTPEMVEETFSWAANRATTLASFSADRLAKRRAEIATGGTATLGGQERVLMSPALVGHLLTHYDAMIRCLGSALDESAPPPSDTNFAPCVGEEFPVDAAVVKARWIPNTGPIEVFDTSADALKTKLGAGDWGDATKNASPTADAIYTMHVTPTLDARLVALHVVTKELRDWTWITLFWSDAPTTDFGADRPDAIAGPWASYKMCAVVDYDERDDGSAPSARTGDASLAASLAVTRGFGPRTWCSNPYLEKGAHNATTNCIGCHQHAGTGLGTDAILGDSASFPDGSRARVRKNFPADYTFVTTSGLDLASLMRDKLDQIVPSP